MMYGKAARRWWKDLHPSGNNECVALELLKDVKMVIKYSLEAAKACSCSIEHILEMDHETSSLVLYMTLRTLGKPERSKELFGSRALGVLLGQPSKKRALEIVMPGAFEELLQAESRS
jgi:hypothetical protein